MERLDERGGSKENKMQSIERKISDRFVSNYASLKMVPYDSF